MTKRVNTNCANCGQSTKIGMRATMSTSKKGKDIYLCHGPGVKQDCYMAAVTDLELRARLTGKEVAR